MGGLDRAALALLLLVTAVFSLILVLVAAGWSDPLQAFEAALAGPEGRWAVAAVGLLAFVASARVLGAGLRGRDPRPALVRQLPLGEVEVALGAVEGLVARTGRQLEGVRDLRARIAPGEKGLNVELRAWVGSDVRVPDLCDRLQQAVRQKIQGVVGTEVGEVRILIREIGGESRRRRIE